MKVLTALTVAAALAAGMSVAGAQSTMQQPSAAPQESTTGAVGNSPFCSKPRTGSGGLQCNYATMAECQQDAQPAGKTCVSNPQAGTTGAGAESGAGMKN